MGRSAFLDETIIEVEGGRGGNGSASFLRTRRQPKGGPDGGNGGDGGDVYAVADGSVNSLYDFITKHKFQAQEGGHGGSKKCHGHDGGDLYLKMPVGTDIRDEVTGALHASLLDAGEQVLLVKGGKGGRGNVTFKSSTNRAPRESTLGSEGDKQVFHLSLRILADVGLVGLPNSGKSTFLNSVSNAHAPIGDYPFTTLKPCLGTIELEDYSQLTIADTPGLVDGASRGVGLGARFLRHVSRSKVLLHFVDASCADAKKILGQQDRLVTEIKLAESWRFAEKAPGVGAVQDRPSG